MDSHMLPAFVLRDHVTDELLINSSSNWAIFVITSGDSLRSRSAHTNDPFRIRGSQNLVYNA